MNSSWCCVFVFVVLLLCVCVLFGVVLVNMCLGSVFCLLLCSGVAVRVCCLCLLDCAGTACRLLYTRLWLIDCVCCCLFVIACLC